MTARKDSAPTIKTPPERIVEIDALTAVFNAKMMLRDRKFLVHLACGHLTYTRARKSAVCPRCSEMLRRSIADGSEDWESFRQGKVRDRMIWREDPCRAFHEKTDLAGNLVDDP